MLLFEEAEKFGMRLAAGKVMMDRNAPEQLLDTPKTGYDDSKALIKKWHNRGRLHVRDHAALRADQYAASNWKRQVRSAASIPTATCRPMCRRTKARSPG